MDLLDKFGLFRRYTVARIAVRELGSHIPKSNNSAAERRRRASWYRGEVLARSAHGHRELFGANCAAVRS